MLKAYLRARGKAGKADKDGCIIPRTFRIDCFRFDSAPNYKEICQQASNYIADALKFYELSDISKLRIKFLQENPEYNSIYQKLITGQLLSENEFWDSLDAYKEEEKKVLHQNIVEPGLANALIKFTPRNTVQPEIMFTIADVKMLCRY